MSDETRAKARAAGWVYHGKHPTIELEYATIRTEHGIEMRTCDKVHYDHQETAIVNNGGGSKLVHEVKKQFDGVLVDVDERR